MSLVPGTRLGPYEIVSAIGAGGMGEVYRAKDTRLDREVAIKVLPTAVAADADRRTRFEREAKAVAALSHPNILAIHDVGVADDVAYAVTELLRGATLRDRLQDGALPVRKAVDTAIQIARGLAAAHDKGLIHRDLKPENVFLLDDGQMKILDFGLAKDAATFAAPDSRTMTAMAMTDPGTVMGTVGYMAPEQVRGQQIDARADLFAFGALLYEMLSGERAFKRDTTAETMTAILKEDPPDLVTTRAELPAALDRIVRHCLEKNPVERFQTARDIAFALGALSGSGTARVAAVPDTTRSSRRSNLGVMAAVVIVAAIVSAGAMWWLRQGAVQPVQKFDLAIEGLETGQGYVPIIAPDGHAVVYSASGRLWVRAFDDMDGTEVPESAGARYPAWSPDSRALAFVRDGQLWRASTSGGKAVALGHVPPDMTGSGGLCWLGDGRIFLIGSDATGITSISERGGELTEPLKIDKKTEIDYHEMSRLPGAGVIFTVHHVESQRADTIDAFVNGVHKTIFTLKGESMRRPVYSPTGHLVYQRESMNPGVWAVKFSPKTLSTEGEPFLVVPGGSLPSIGANGTLLLVRPSGAMPDLLWIDRSGASSKITTLPKPVAFTGSNRVHALSPDAKRVLLALQNASVSDLWMYTFASGALTPVTRGAGQAVFPLWLPDNRRALMSGTFDGRVWGVHRITVDSGAVERLTRPELYQGVDTLTPDGRTIIIDQFGGDTTLHTVSIDATGRAGAPAPMPKSTGTDEWGAMLSPDGRWMAFMSRQNGRNRIFIRRFPSGAAAHLVSTEGATVAGAPVWSRDSKELLYRSDDVILSTMVSESGTGIITSPTKQVALLPFRHGYLWTFDVGPDGRILTLHVPGNDHIAVILNWPEEAMRIERAGIGR